MRINMPVTNVEVPLRDDTLIVSKTDLKGQLTYINKDFLDISGFTEAELIGVSHNIVRHPDMPIEAFEDLWRDLKAERPWTGYVKNRCKNGDYYWVLATATPILENGQVTGYMSVRRKASREAIAAVDQAYRMFREKQAGGASIRHGAVVKGGEGFLAGVTLKSKMMSSTIRDIRDRELSTFCIVPHWSRSAAFCHSLRFLVFPSNHASMRCCEPRVCSMSRASYSRSSTTPSSTPSLNL